ncbi:hypothetical protein PybrP1_001625 [[Pythium] brassicae (nom. inval.)]|nr:hypothetical protein PybrP1_001625 [[Pythium] brassicae (nom. inval.)]
MADIIDKIGKYFAEQEAQLRRVYAQSAANPSQPIIYHAVSHHQQPTLSRQLSEPDELPGRGSTKERHPPSLLRRRSSTRSDTDVPALQQQLTARGAKSSPGSVVVAVPPLVFSPAPTQPLDAKLRSTARKQDEHAWSDEEGFASWRSARLHPEVDKAHSEARRLRMRPPPALMTAAAAHAAAAPRPEVESSNSDGSDADQQTESQAMSTRSGSRNDVQATPALRRKGSTKRRRKKKRRGSGKSNQSDAEQQKQENEEKVAAALVRAQERARRIQTEREQEVRDRELARRDEQRRVHKEMDKIEAMRQKSRQFALRLRPSSAVCSSSEAERSAAPLPARSSTWETTRTTAINSCESTKSILQPSERTTTTNAQQAHVQESRRVHAQLERQRASNAKTQQRVDALGATNESLERELADALEQLRLTRSQRSDLEDASRTQRLQRLKDTERQLRARVRSEERERLADEEKVRAEIAAGARARAGQRVVSRASSLKKKAHEGQDARGSQHRGRSNNNADEADDDDAGFVLPTRSARPPTPVASGSKTALLLPPELAEFEEEGLFDSSELTTDRVPASPEVPVRSGSGSKDTRAALPTVRDGPEAPNEATTSRSSPEEFKWRVPPIEDRAMIARVLVFEIPSP